VDRFDKGGVSGVHVIADQGRRLVGHLVGQGGSSIGM
jgi:hypothetical protein